MNRQPPASLRQPPSISSHVFEHDAEDVPIEVEDDAAALVQRRQRHRRETRGQLLERLLNPQISLHEASVLLRVCPATVRNYANAGLLPHVRTAGRQRRFYLRDVLNLLRQLDSLRK